jgi:hypothetical protein
METIEQHQLNLDGKLCINWASIKFAHKENVIRFEDTKQTIVLFPHVPKMMPKNNLPNAKIFNESSHYGAKHVAINRRWCPRPSVIKSLQYAWASRVVTVFTDGYQFDHRHLLHVTDGCPADDVVLQDPQSHAALAAIIKHQFGLDNQDASIRMQEAGWTAADIEEFHRQKCCL